MRDINFVVGEQSNGYYGGDTQKVPFHLKSKSKTLISAILLAHEAYSLTGYKFEIYKYDQDEDEDEEKREPLLRHEDIITGYAMRGMEI